MQTTTKLIPAVLLAAVVLLAGCGGTDQAGDDDAQGRESRTVRVETLELRPTRFEDVIEVTGSVGAIDDAILSAQANGTITSLVELGDFVRAGQIVAQLDPRIAQAAVEQAQAQVESVQSSYELAQDNLRRNEPLFSDSIISALEFENVRSQAAQSRAALAQAEAALAQAEEQLRNTRVVAPFSGTIEERFVRRGEQIVAGSQIARIVNTSRVKVRAGVPERYAGDVTLGTDVRVNLNAYGRGSRIPARVSFVGGAVDAQSRTFPIEVEIPNPDGRIKPEMVATVFVTRATLSDVFVVPRPALIREESGFMVYTVDRSTSAPVAERRPVVTGSSYGNEVVIQSGLTDGDEVVVQGQNNVSQGERLDVVEVHQAVEATTEPGEDNLSVLPPAP